MTSMEAVELLDAVRDGKRSAATAAQVREALKLTGDIPDEMDGAYLLNRIRMCCIDDAGCWIWQRHAQKGVMPIINIEGKVMSSRRAAFIALHGEVKPGHEVMGGCEAPLCVNPECSKQVTFAERRRRMAKKRNYGQSNRMKPAHSKLSIEKARQIRSSEEPTAVLAERFGVSKAAIGYAKRGSTWAEPSPWAGLGARA